MMQLLFKIFDKVFQLLRQKTVCRLRSLFAFYGCRNLSIYEFLTDLQRHSSRHFFYAHVSPIKNPKRQFPLSLRLTFFTRVRLRFECTPSTNIFVNVSITNLRLYRFE